MREENVIEREKNTQGKTQGEREREREHRSTTELFPCLKMSTSKKSVSPSVGAYWWAMDVSLLQNESGCKAKPREVQNSLVTGWLWPHILYESKPHAFSAQRLALFAALHCN